MLETLLYVALALLAISISGALYRVIKGPSLPDRIIALDVIGINIIGLVSILSILMQTTAYLNIILLIGILAFIATVAFAKFIERGDIFERKHH